MPRTGRPAKGASAKAVPMSIRLTARQHELLRQIATRLTTQTREVSRFAPEISTVEALRMMIMLTAQEMGLIELNDEPSEAFDLKPKRKRPQ